MPWPKATIDGQRRYGPGWEKLRLQILQRDCYLCQVCKGAGRIESGHIVDHVKPKSAGGDDAPANLQTICTRCHQRKTIRERGQEPRRRVGPDGWFLPDDNI